MVTIRGLQMVRGLGPNQQLGLESYTCLACQLSLQKLDRNTGLPRAPYLDSSLGIRRYWGHGLGVRSLILIHFHSKSKT